MGSLQNARIDQSYPGLIKTNDEAAIGATEKVLQDGSGNNSTLSLGTASASFTGTLDLTGATVTGLPSGAAGLESGTGLHSMQSAASLTNTAANASGTKSVALGDNAQADNESVVIGPAASSTGGSGSNVAIGNNADCLGSGGGKVAIGLNATASGDNAVAVGNSDATGSNSVSLGIVANATNTYSLALGRSVTSSGQASVAAGYNGTAPNAGDVNIGDSNSIATKTALPGDVVIGQGNNSSTVNGGENVLIGKNNTVTQNERNAAIGYNNTISRGAHYILGAGNTSSLQYNIGIVGNDNTATGEKSFIGGHNSSTTATGAVALGDGVAAATAQTVSVKALETQTASTPTAGGIIMKDAGSTSRRLNIDASGNLQVDSTPVGGATAVSSTTKSSLSGPSVADAIYGTLTIPGNTFGAGDIVKLWNMISMDYTGGGTIYANVKISDSATLAGGTFNYTIGSQSSTSAAGFIHNKSIIIHTANGTGDGSDAGSVDPYHESDVYPNGNFSFADNQGMAIDWTSNVYVHFFGFVDNAGSSVTYNGGYIKKMN